ncbi:hypothetical protein BC827DRAFT_174088 [Russula dissimulans]|nr:hypothetical protein BC827DRAFT_174088 [Russula dissimulans]
MGIMHHDLKAENILLSPLRRRADCRPGRRACTRRLLPHLKPELCLRHSIHARLCGARTRRQCTFVRTVHGSCRAHAAHAMALRSTEKMDLLEYTEQYKAHNGRAQLCSWCTMSENEVRVPYGQAVAFEELERESFFEAWLDCFYMSWIGIRFLMGSAWLSRSSSMRRRAASPNQGNHHGPRDSVASA